MREKILCCGQLMDYVVEKTISGMAEYICQECSRRVEARETGPPSTKSDHCIATGGDISDGYQPGHA